jgi:hypothetical protein
MLFNELSEDRKLQEIEKLRNDESYLDYDWWNFCDEDFKTILELLGFYRINTFFSGFWSQGDGASFTARYSNEKRITTKIKYYAPLDLELHRIAKGIQDIQQSCKYEFVGSIYCTGNYSHSHTMRFETEDYNNPKIDEYEDDFLQLCRDLADWYYEKLEQEWDFLNSDEAISEHLNSNEYDFEGEE